MIRKSCIAASACLALAGTGAIGADDVDSAAKVLGDRGDILQTSLSPSGSKIAFVAPLNSRAEAVFVVDMDHGAKPSPVLQVDEAGTHLTSCHWPTDAQLICNLRATVPIQGFMVGFSRLYVVNADAAARGL